MPSSSMPTVAVFMLCYITLLPMALSQKLGSLISLSQLLSTDPPKSTSGNVNIINTTDDNTGEISSLSLAYLPFLFFFTTGDGIPNNALGSYESFAAIALAMEHLNTGNGDIIPELNGINNTCPLRFTSKAFDTEASQRVGVDRIISLTDRSRTDQLLPSSILGAAYSSISIPTSIISGLRGFPQVSPISTSSTLDDKGQYKLFARTVPNDDGTAIPLLVKLNSWDVQYLAVLHVDNAYGNAFAKGITLTAQRDFPGLRVETVDILYGAGKEEVAEAVRKLKNTQYTYVFAILYSEDVENIMTEAFNQGIAGTGIHNWIFSDGLGSYVTSRTFEIGSPLEKAFRGTSVLSAVGGVKGIDQFDKLTRSLQQLGENEEDVSYIESLLPTDYLDGKVVNHTIVTRGESFLSEPGLVAPFMYDAVIAIGVSACRLVEASESGSKNQFFSGEELFDELLSNTTSFEGTSGLIVLDAATGTRDPRSALYSLTNYIDDKDASGQGIVQFQAVATDLFRDGKWETTSLYTFNDGTNKVPSDLPLLETDPNYISTGLRAVGLILCISIIGMALGLSYWTFRNSDKRVVKSSQPIFLHIITGGTVLMGSAIIPLTVDMGIASQEGANTACMSYPWLLALGFSLTFSALFTKTYRILKIMKHARQFKRIKLTAIDVMKPMFTLLMLNIMILTIWTIIDPLKHETVVVEQDSFSRNLETYGVCSSEHQVIFLSVLGVMNLGLLLCAVFMAYRARNIATELQESNYIFSAMALILLVSFIGVPVIIIARENVSAFYFVSAGLIFVVCQAILLLIFVPKVKALSDKEKARQSPSGDRSSLPSSVSSSSGDDEGIRILHTRPVEAELEKKVADLERLLEEKENAAGQKVVRMPSVTFAKDDHAGMSSTEKVPSDSYDSFEHYLYDTKPSAVSMQNGDNNQGN